ncbi:hypothetical protein WJX73_002664 [Symbiochloris irregularis]|uniref:Peptidase S9 prolyl oligopeptidase catalytic domain-containing protein n=1 Tax=Symbiochloris irregularis TaxID=706552 RepID=A0AAW1NPP2_9CHLO
MSESHERTAKPSDHFPNDTSNALQNAANDANTGLNKATNATNNFVNKASNDVTKETKFFVSDFDNLTAVVGDDIATYINKTVFNGQRHPIVFWPAYGTSILKVEVEGNTAANCPTSGSFDVAFGQPTIVEGFPESCIYPLLQMQYDAANGGFSNAPGVNTSIFDFGGQFCAPIPYEPLFAVAQAIGYTTGKDFMVACYDWRTNPGVEVGGGVTGGADMDLAAELVETAYNNSGGLPVYLAGHSNGPIYALALLHEMSADWIAKYVAGFISYAGNWQGQGSIYSQQLISGASLFNDAAYPSSVPAYESWPSTYISAPNPQYYGDSEVVVRTLDANGTVAAQNYTPVDALQLFRDAGLTTAQQLGPLLLNRTSSNQPPGTSFYGFIGTGVKTLVGNTYTTVFAGAQPVKNGEIDSIDEGDGNQENRDNEWPLTWQSEMDPCQHFELNREEGAQHLTLPFHPSVLKRTVQILYSAPAACGGVAEAPGTDFVPAEAPSGPSSLFFTSTSPSPGSSQAGRH